MSKESVNSEESAAYGGTPTNPTDPRDDENAIISKAQDIIKRRFSETAHVREHLSSPAQSAQYLQVLIGDKEHEVFGMLSLDNRNKVLAWDELFRGTIDGCSVYPREVIKLVMQRNAAAVIFAHNHPSGTPEPSSADTNITTRLKKALALIDVRVLDHIVVGGTCTSMAERGLL